MEPKNLMSPSIKPKTNSKLILSRREFSRSLGATALSTPFIIKPNSTLAKERESNDRIGRGEIGPVKYRGPAHAARLNTLILMAQNNRNFRISIRQGLRQFNTNRANLGFLLGDLSRPLISEQLEGASRVGSLHVNASTLFLLMAGGINAEDLPVELQLLIVHRQLSWELRGLWDKSVEIAPRSDRTLAEEVGTLYLIENLLIAILPPAKYT